MHGTLPECPVPKPVSRATPMSANQMNFRRTGRGKYSGPNRNPNLASRPALVLMKGPEDAPFLISWRSRRELGRAYVWQFAVMLCGGTVLTLAGLYVLLLKMHLL